MRDEKLQPTARHNAYEQALFDRDLLPTMALGSAGTGKTYGAVKRAISWLKEGNQQKVIIIRPNESFAKTLGFTPGDLIEKLGNWVRPVLDCFVEQDFNMNMIESALKHGKIEFVALEHIQGRSFHNALIIVDECENMTMEQLQGTVTRMGRHSKLVLCGDIKQTSPLFRNGGLAEFQDFCEYLDMPIHIVEFTPDDVLRGGLAKRFIVGFEEWDEMKVREGRK